MRFAWGCFSLVGDERCVPGFCCADPAPVWRTAKEPRIPTGDLGCQSFLHERASRADLPVCYRVIALTGSSCSLLTIGGELHPSGVIVLQPPFFTFSRPPIDTR